ncbi:hypothetical protein J22TS1_44020 [Siminovitchia terrae]|uniref:hypothetical protein n=1 Tax=Siminovitchia terrae TaxID=1914933 RepID=UPI001AFDB781|nr:hypothetical protein [Siminovitchia terrae]GIN93351.1 hypothetical protein J22TS1_44020 [Siminovitchia terrae]
MTQGLQVGEWVKRKMNGKIGWIAATRANEGVDVVYPDATYTSSLQSFNLENYDAILPEVREEAKWIFVELALVTNDEEWFMEVTGN